MPTVTASHVKNQEVIKGKTTYDVQFRNRYEQPDLEKLLQNQPNKIAYERFMKYARSGKHFYRIQKEAANNNANDICRNEEQIWRR